MPQAFKVEGVFLFDELDSNVAVRLNFCSGQAELSAENLIIVQHTVVRQGKDILPGASREGMVVVVALCTALRGHPGVAHHHPCRFRNPNVHAMRRNRPLIDPLGPSHIVGNPGGIGSANLTGGGQDRDDPALLPSGEVVAIINQSKQAAHLRSPPQPKSRR